MRRVPQGCGAPGGGEQFPAPPKVQFVAASVPQGPTIQMSFTRFVNTRVH